MVNGVTALAPTDSRLGVEAAPKAGPDASAQPFAAYIARATSTPTARISVPLQATRLSGEQAGEALSTAWTQVMGSPPSKATLSVLVAQWAHETGRGQSMMNYNFGGIKGTGPSGLTTTSKTMEGEGQNAVSTTDHFRAYRNAAEGATDYISLLKAHYPQAVAAATNGDPVAFVAGLKKNGYFTGSLADYTKSVTSLAHEAYANGYGANGTVPGTAVAAAMPRTVPSLHATLGANSPPVPTPEALGDQFIAQALASAGGASSPFSAPHVSTAALIDHLAYSALRIGVGASPETGGVLANDSAPSLRRRSPG